MDNFEEWLNEIYPIKGYVVTQTNSSSIFDSTGPEIIGIAKSKMEAFKIFLAEIIKCGNLNVFQDLYEREYFDDYELFIRRIIKALENNYESLNDDLYFDYDEGFVSNHSFEHMGNIISINECKG